MILSLDTDCGEMLYRKLETPQFSLAVTSFGCFPLVPQKSPVGFGGGIVWLWCAQAPQRTVRMGKAGSALAGGEFLFNWRAVEGS